MSTPGFSYHKVRLELISKLLHFLTVKTRISFKGLPKFASIYYVLLHINFRSCLPYQYITNRRGRAIVTPEIPSTEIITV